MLEQLELKMPISKPLEEKCVLKTCSLLQLHMNPDILYTTTLKNKKYTLILSPNICVEDNLLRDITVLLYLLLFLLLKLHV